MDDGYVIPNLGEPWSFMGCRIFEWSAGIAVSMTFQEMFIPNLGAGMPIFMAVLFGTAFLMAQLRRRYPDEERGMMNEILSNLGFAPPMMPAPAKIQPLWSGAPLRELPEKREFITLGLDKINFNAPPEESKDGIIGR